MRRGFVVVALGLWSAGARADPVQLRMASISPDGTAWARELRAFGRDIEIHTAGRVLMKWYFGGIAGDELSVLERIRRDQLDGEAGAQFCDRVAPSLRVTRVLGLFQSREESSYIVGRLRATLDPEFRKSGFLGHVSGIGNDILFTREPVRSMADMRSKKLWLWNLDDVMSMQLKAMKIPVSLMPVEAAALAYEQRRIDGWIAIPTAALAFQWSSRASYFTDIRLGFLPGCVVIVNRAVDALQIADQHAILEAFAKLVLRFEDIGRAQDKALIDGGLFAKQGLKPVPVSQVFRSEFFTAAHETRDSIDAKLVSKELLSKVESWLADYRAEHR